MPSDQLADRLDSVRADVARAAGDAGRSVDDILTIVITKFHPAELVRDLFELGVRDVGENRNQDAAPKAAQLESLDLNWHFVGQLQSNKVRAVLAYARDIQSIDRPSLVDAIASAGIPAESPIDAFIQVNLTADSARGGVTPENLEPLVERLLVERGIRFRGLMAVAPLDEEPRAAFARVREASERIRSLAPDATALSMGMSADFREAILEGATHLRIGTAITGKRPPAS
jgi:pyridoxal phosphate enzyme (YggS family)